MRTNARERTFIMIKPDGVQRGIVGKIIKRFEQKGFKLVAMKFVWAGEDLLSKHYADLSARPFFPGLVKYMSSGPVVPMVWEGLNAVKTGRVMLGATNPADSAPGTIRGDLCIQLIFMIISLLALSVLHLSSIISNENAGFEVALQKYLWTIHFIIRTILPAVSGENLHNVMEKMKNFVYKHSIYSNLDNYQCRILTSFRRRITEEQVKIKVGNMFDINFTLLYSIAGVIASYTVILLQIPQKDPQG